MFVVISYDIVDDKRRNKLSKLLKNYGQRVQYSVFECNLKEEEMIILKSRIMKIIRKTDDSIRFYYLCDRCKKEIDRIGGIMPLDEEVFIY